MAVEEWIDGTQNTPMDAAAVCQEPHSAIQRSFIESCHHPSCSILDHPKANG